jgi:hypothetical protein
MRPEPEAPRRPDRGRERGRTRGAVRGPVGCPKRAKRGRPVADDRTVRA